MLVKDLLLRYWPVITVLAYLLYFKKGKFSTLLAIIMLPSVQKQSFRFQVFVLGFVCKSWLQEVGKQTSVWNETAESQNSTTVWGKILGPQTGVFFSFSFCTCACMRVWEREAATWDTVVHTLTHFEHCSADASRLNTETMCLHPSVSLLLP